MQGEKKMKNRGGTAAGREDECDFPEIPSVFNDIFQYYFLGQYTHTSLQIKQSPFAPGCQKKSKLEYLLQVLSESHTASVTQSPWIPVVPLHCPRSGVPVTTDILIITNITCSSGNILPELFSVVALRGRVFCLWTGKEPQPTALTTRHRTLCFLSASQPRSK